MRGESIDLVLFEHEAAAARAFHDAGLRNFMVDHETRGKARRQLGADTEINEAPLEAIGGLAGLDGARVHCRINGWHAGSQREIETAVRLGAARIYLPMVESAGEAEAFIRALDGRAEAALMFETDAAVTNIADFSHLPVDAAFVGLNDLAISRGKTFIFCPFLDGTLDRIRAALPRVALGFGGVTCVDRGDPVPFRALLAEMAAVGANFSFLRRSFRRDIVGRDVTEELRRVQQLWTQLRRRSAGEIEADRVQFRTLVQRLADA